MKAFVEALPPSAFLIQDAARAAKGDVVAEARRLVPPPADPLEGARMAEVIAESEAWGRAFRELCVYGQGLCDERFRRTNPDAIRMEEFFASMRR